jgi:signal transduction histidine kinase
VILTIADNGPGIPEGNLPRVFDPFFSTKAVGRGTGLGLAVVYGLVRDLGGTIDVESRDGAVFTIRLREVTKEEYA